MSNQSESTSPSRVIRLAWMLLLGMVLAGAAADSGTVLKVPGGKEYYDATVSRLQGDSVVLRHRGGISRVNINDLSDEDRQRLGLPTREAKKARDDEARRKLQEQDARWRAFAAEQERKGLVYYQSQWMTPAQKSVREVDEQADLIVTGKFQTGVSYQVLQALADGLLCVAQKQNRVIGPSYTGDVFFLFGINNTIIADGEEYKDDLYWTGTYSYKTVGGVQKTVNSYCPDRALAREIVKKRYGLLGDAEPVATAPDQPAKAGEQGSQDPKACGTGFIVTADGYVLTNHHVVEGMQSVSVVTENGPLTATVVASDPDNDVALLKVPGTFAPVSFVPDTAMSLGATVFTVGFPMPDIQGFSPKVTKGVVSGLKGMRDDVRMLQIDASIQPGNSGGPLSDEFGNVVGIVSAKLNEAALLVATGVVPQNVNYALKKSYALALMENCPLAQAGIKQGSKVPISFEQAVEKVRKSTVMVLVR